VSTYSLGMRQRLGIAQALLGNPDILILDEPANGLDPAGIREIRQLVRHLAADRGIAVFVSSHLLSEVEQTCDRVAIIHRGRTLAAGPVRELVDRVASDRLRLRVRPAEKAAGILAGFGAVEPAAAAAEGEDTIEARIPKERVPDALRALTAGGVDVFAVERTAASLEEVFLEVTGGETV
jgi:ABC-2 type transport system ATP-binding protein